jgi:hypothetical protein
MEKTSQSLTADELFESLQQDKFINAVTITLIGMVKKSEGEGKNNPVCSRRQLF